MRWLAFSILAYLVLGLQIGAGDYAQVGWSWAQPNFVLIAVIFVTLNAPAEAALMGAFVLGAMQDLTAQQPFGLYALSYGMVALALTGATQAIYRDHPITHFTSVLFGGCVTAVVLTFHNWIYHGGMGASTLFASALYSAILAPLILWPLQKSRRMFGFQAARRRVRAF